MATTVDEYLKAQPAAVRAKLTRVRSVIRKAVPSAEERISYQIPAYRLHDRMLIFFAGWKQHYSIYPATQGVVAAFARELEPYKVSKGTIRFPLDQPVPVHLIAGIAKVRAAENAELAEVKALTKQRRSSTKAPKKKKAQARRTR
ncbi:MAG: DUF1801 domain-containing protein [Archangium sp.]|nr:DUF1801 domain-containing protein [Archangium sp.]